MPQGNGFIIKDKNKVPQKVLGIQEKTDGSLVDTEDKNVDDSLQKWTVTTLAKDSGEELLMFSIDGLVLTGNWNINVQGNYALQLISKQKSDTKGQIISKRFFSGRGFAQKTNENTSHTSKNEFIRSFFGRILGLTVSFRN